MPPSIITTANRSDILPLSPTYSHLSIVAFPPANPTIHFISIAGQVGTPPPTSPPGLPAPNPASFHEQAINAFANVAACLAVGGAKPQDITKITIYVVDYEESMKSVLGEVITNFFQIRGQEKQHTPLSMLLGVAALASKDFLIEVDATAVVTV